MTYEEAREKELFMPDMKHMRTKVTTYNGGESYFVTYVPDVKGMLGAGMSFGMGMEYELRSVMHERLIHMDIENFDKDTKEPPTGRTQKQHNLIQTLNKRGKRW
jgi:hypothetical protein